jgi:hypothetical protein
LKSRATIIEWSLFQIHFVSADMIRWVQWSYMNQNLESFRDS